MFCLELTYESEEVFDLSPHGSDERLIHQTITNSIDKVNDLRIIRTQSGDSNGVCVKQFVATLVDNDIVFVGFVF